MTLLDDMLGVIDEEELWFGAFEDHRPLCARMLDAAIAAGAEVRAARDMHELDFALRLGLLLGAAIATGQRFDYDAIAAQGSRSVDDTARDLDGTDLVELRGCRTLRVVPPAP